MRKAEFAGMILLIIGVLIISGCVGNDAKLQKLPYNDIGTKTVPPENNLPENVNYNPQPYQGKVVSNIKNAKNPLIMVGVTKKNYAEEGMEGYEYELAYYVANTGDSDLTFDLIGTSIFTGNEGIIFSVTANDGPGGKWIVKPKEVKKIGDLGDDHKYQVLDFERQDGELKVFTILYNDGQFVEDAYSGILPPLSVLSEQNEVIVPFNAVNLDTEEARSWMNGLYSKFLKVTRR